MEQASALTCDSVNARKGSVTFPEPICTDLTNIQLRHMPIAYIEFRPNRTWHVQSAGVNLLMPSNKEWL
jgi:hypothetical protein